jgi:hypothetical protein
VPVLDSGADPELVVLADTHADGDPSLAGHLRATVAGVEQFGDLSVLNPGSHADPRGGQPACARLERVDDVVGGGLWTPTGERIRTVELPGGPKRGDASSGTDRGKK